MPRAAEITKTKSLFSDGCQVPYLFFSTSLGGTFSFNTEESTSSPSMVDTRTNALLSFDGINKRLYLYTDRIESYKLDGSDLTTIGISHLKFFTVDGRNNLIYYYHIVDERIWVYNITSAQQNYVVPLRRVSSVKDMEIDTRNG